MELEEINLEEFKIYIAEKIYTHRKINNLTQEKLSEKAFISIDYMSRIELGGSIPTILKFVYLCNALKVTPNDLLGKYIIESTTYNKIRETLNTLNKLLN